jgi:hypothetical protein
LIWRGREKEEGRKKRRKEGRKKEEGQRERKKGGRRNEAVQLAGAST